MTDILADYREWRSKQQERIGTHSDRCHLWPSHERCMIHRLAKEVERLRLTDEEREAVLSCAIDDEAASAFQRADILRGLLERLGGAR